MWLYVPAIPIACKPLKYREGQSWRVRDWTDGVRCQRGPGRAQNWENASFDARLGTP
jgi:hypothetical protein